MSEAAYNNCMQYNKKDYLYVYDNRDTELINIRVFPNDKVEILYYQNDFTLKTYNYHNFLRLINFGERLYVLLDKEQNKVLIDLAKQKYKEKFPDLDHEPNEHIGEPLFITESYLEKQDREKEMQEQFEEFNDNKKEEDIK